MHMRIEAVRVIGRYRKDLGDIDALAKSIAAVGLINPITITSDGQLIAGQRRLEACRLLRWDLIAAVTADDLDAAVGHLSAERDENTERKAMTPEELVDLGLALEELERPKAEIRQRESRSKAGKIRQGTYEPDNSASGSREPDAEDAGRTRERVAEALGMGGTTYSRAKAVVETANDETLPPAEQEIAREALTDMNTTGNIGGNYNKIRDAGLAPHQRTVAPASDSQPGLRQKPIIGDAKKQRHAITGAVASLSGITLGLKRIEELHPDITCEEAAQWVGDLSEARRVIEALIKRLKERTNAKA